MPSTRTLRVRVDGEPAPQGSKNAFVNPKTNKVVMVESSAKVKPWRATVQAAVQNAVTRTCWAPLDGPVTVQLLFAMRRGKTVTRQYPTVKPDIDKLTRAALDALTAGKAFTDDARVVRLVVDQVYAAPGAQPGVLITVTPRND